MEERVAWPLVTVQLRHHSVPMFIEVFLLMTKREHTTDREHLQKAAELFMAMDKHEVFSIFGSAVTKNLHKMNTVNQTRTYASAVESRGAYMTLFPSGN